MYEITQELKEALDKVLKKASENITYQNYSNSEMTLLLNAKDLVNNLSISGVRKSVNCGNCGKEESNMYCEKCYNLAWEE